MNLLLDIFAAAVLCIGLIDGIRKGLAKTFFSLLGSIGGFLAAILFSRQLSVFVNEKLVSPLLQERTTQYLEKLLGAKTAADGSSYVAVEDYLNQVPDLFGEYIKKMGGSVKDVQSAFNVAPTIEAGRQAAIRSIYSVFASTLSTCIAFLAIFFGVMVLCAILGAVFGAIFKLPVLSTVNKLGGGIAGLAKSAVVLVVIASIFMLVTPIYKGEDVSFLGSTDINQTHIMKHFALFKNLGGDTSNGGETK